ncbi:MAG TPA: hypothetical protein VFQ71_02500 [Gaiellales bacterium]|jgi:hypothetical protein|nr:hypothetical protein [Gaiellales bacterium]
MDIITLTLTLAALWLLYLAAVATTAVAVRDAHTSRLIPSVATGGLFVCSALSLLVVAVAR